MQANRAKALQWIFEDEGGYVLRPDGGMAKYGIGLHTLADYMQKHKLGWPTYWDLEHLKPEVAGQIYEEIYFSRVAFDDLNSGPDYAFVDMAVNLGVTGAIQQVQQLLEVPVAEKWANMDGTTLAVFNGRDPSELIPQIRDIWINIKRKAPNYPKRGPGWEARDKRVRARALDLVGTAG